MYMDRGWHGWEQEAQKKDGECHLCPRMRSMAVRETTYHGRANTCSSGALSPIMGVNISEKEP